MEDEFTQELLNNINQLASHMQKLAIWEKVIEGYSEDEQFEIRFEFTRPLLYYVLHQPYEFKSRLIFCSVQLCYQLGLASGTLSKKELVDDWGVKLETLKHVVAKTSIGSALVAAIEQINHKDFVQGTQNYRHRSQHQIAPRLDYGITNRIVRSTAKDGSLVHSYGTAPPITTVQAMPLLVEQSKRMIAGFHAYWALVQEHADASPQIDAAGDVFAALPGTNPPMSSEEENGA
jgi:hypothetical protein